MIREKLIYMHYNRPIKYMYRPCSCAIQTHECLPKVFFRPLHPTTFRMRLLSLAVLLLARLSAGQATYTLDEVSAQVASYKLDLQNGTLSSRSALPSGCELAVGTPLSIKICAVQ
jgi:hypothetical protein